MTSFLGEAGEGTAVAIYGIDLFLASLMLTVVIRYSASRPDLVSSDLADEELMNSVRQRSALLGFQAVAVVIALVLPNLAVALYLVISVLFIVAPLVLARKSPT
jgi:Mn2+/Fe2+ NRAMP family transporter